MVGWDVGSSRLVPPPFLKPAGSRQNHRGLPGGAERCSLISLFTSAASSTWRLGMWPNRVSLKCLSCSFRFSQSKSHAIFELWLMCIIQRSICLFKGTSIYKYTSYLAPGGETEPELDAQSAGS